MLSVSSASCTLVINYLIVDYLLVRDLVGSSIVNRMNLAEEEGGRDWEVGEGCV